jgi:hypothetical protein
VSSSSLDRSSRKLAMTIQREIHVYPGIGLMRLILIRRRKTLRPRNVGAEMDT